MSMYPTFEKAKEDWSRFHNHGDFTAIMKALASSSDVTQNAKANKPIIFIQWAATDRGLGLGLAAAKFLHGLISKSVSI